MGMWCKLFHTPIKTQRVSIYSFLRLAFENFLLEMNISDVKTLLIEVANQLPKIDKSQFKCSSNIIKNSEYKEDPYLKYILEEFDRMEYLDEKWKELKLIRDREIYSKDREIVKKKMDKLYAEEVKILKDIEPVFVFIQIRYCIECDRLIDPRETLLSFIPKLAEKMKILKRNEEAGFFSLY